MSGRFIPGVFVAVVSVVAVALVWMGVRDDYESFTPPVATAVDRADCLDSDIATALVAPEARDDSSALRSEGSGYPPADFSPIAVVRCERGETSDGRLTIDSVRLEGDMHAVNDAFCEQSRPKSGAEALRVRGRGLLGSSLAITNEVRSERGLRLREIYCAGARQ